MIAWFIIGIATLAVFTFLALNATENIAAATELHSRTETVRRMEAAVNSLLAASRSPNATGIAYLPAGRIAGNSYVLPANLEHLAKTPFGQPVVYCPFGGLEAGTTVTVPSANAVSYDVQVAAFNGANYVVGGRPAYVQVSVNPNLLGWVIAARTRNDPIPSCNSVTYNSTTGKFTAPNAIVRPILRTIGPDESREITTREVVWYVSPTGTGNGFSSTTPASLTTALDFWRNRQPGAMRILMSSGTYSLTADYLNIDSGSFANQYTNGTLALEGVGSVTVNQSAGANIQIPGTLEVTNVSFNTNAWLVASRGSRISLNNVTAGRLWVLSGGQATASNITLSSVSAGNEGPIVIQSGGTLNLSGSASLTTGSYAIYSDGGNVAIENSTISTNRSAASRGWHGIYNIAGSVLSVTNSTISFAGQFYGGFYNAGEMTGTSMVINSNTAMNEGIAAFLGSRTVLNNGGISGTSTALPAYGFADFGAGRIDGSNFQLRGTALCWWYGSGSWGNSLNGVFSQSAPSASGANTAVRADVAVPTLTGNSAAEINAYNTALQTNQMRASLRNVNTSSWPCV